ncbi:LacI family DNA-binding transcriptional regulator [Yersinia bercovieri]|uniref:Lac repressor n=2 Tax=Yersinia bercovieri TaxID=634 RepID=A0A2G4U4T6_YERBE|nr:LacI family DNA-binding transcriptional regulator [Yersinia bercovieri]EEQ05652.1 Lactose operon repressor [Yersinia bercovieri ATCC 43970]MCB5301330.1 LacI family DNA-binding transcriptional regulator [Yersinia bercovieri]MDN0101654.1 LacI family DNA-binding transcriptional regulator [Yersinia bercovieri]PHZ28335.1 lac repressor [Yersinia bercovieri]QKJ07894.1 LacI family DNA-binding transcriptional regulator [Yersinia bercovieri ATCC 43970]
MRPKSVTLDDVARQAGVSYQTVSRVLNQAAHVSPKTRCKVEQAMTDLNYVPNRVAQQLAGKHSLTLGLATTDLSLHAPSQIAAAIKSRARELGYSIVIAMVDDHSDHACQQAINELLAQRVDGILVNVPLKPTRSQKVVQQCAGTPVLFLDVDPQSAAFSVLFDPKVGAIQGANHLIALGHQQIALICGPKEAISAQLRYQGWLQALSRASLMPQAVYHGEWDAQSGYQATQKLITSHTPFSAILVANDQMALGVLRALHEHNIDVPGQVSVIGYDDTADSAYFQPPLTTVRQNFKLLGEESVSRLIVRLHHTIEPPSETLLLATQLTIRQTTAPFAPKNE